MTVHIQPLETFFSSIQRLPLHIDEVELFRLDASPTSQFNLSTVENRQHAALRLCANGICGWSEGVVSHNDPSFQLAPWGACFSELKGMTISNALMHHRQHRDSWWVNQLEMAEIALLDLTGRLLDKPVLELFGLKKRQPVPGLVYIHENNPQKASEKAGLARKRNLTTHIKLRIYGESSLDIALVKAVRRVMGPNTFIVADASEGYPHEYGASLEELALKLKALHTAGLNACEDPSALMNAEWVELQAKVGLLDLVTVKPIRPAWQALERLIKGMARIYNLQPGNMISLIDTIMLARHIHNLGGQVAIGGDSLIGPGCTIWQQIAVGLGAVWIEALEKPDESNVFLQCIQLKSTEQKADGRYGLIYDYATRELRPGFGLEVDVPRLRKLCSAYCSI